MATGRITKRAVDAIPIPSGGKRAYLWDETLKGFGCMVTDEGAKSYLVQYRIGGRGSPTRRVTIGRHGSSWTPDTARSRAAELLEQVRRKVDPFNAQREALMAARAEVESKAQSDSELAKLAVNVVADGYIAKAKKTLRRASEQEQVINRDLRPCFGDTPLPSIKAASRAFTRPMGSRRNESRQRTAGRSAWRGSSSGVVRASLSCAARREQYPR